MLNPNQAEGYLDRAIDALASPGDACNAALNALPVPIYTTDGEGRITFWNHACVEFAGREPLLGKDKWCVTWQIHTTCDNYLPHDECPMAVAVKERRAVRGDIAIAKRPDGTRRAFKPYPTPLYDQGSRMIGAVNMLIDVSDEQAGALAAQAEHCNRLANSICDVRASRILRDMADGYDRNARALRPGMIRAG